MSSKTYTKTELLHLAADFTAADRVKLIIDHKDRAPENSATLSPRLKKMVVEALRSLAEGAP
jgi:hypothetical protein